MSGNRRCGWMTPRRIALMGCFAVLMCAALWLRTATFTQSLWYDECLTARVSQVPLLQSVTEITGHNSRHLPLYYWLNHFACMVFQQDWGSRVLALLFGLLALPALMVAGRRVASGAAVAFAMLLLAISPMHVFNSHDAREYSLLMLASLVSTERLINARERDTSGAWAQYCVAVTLSLYTSFFAFLALFSQGLYMLLMQAGVLARARRLTWPAVRPLCGFAACCLTSLVLFGPMFPIMAKWVSGDVGAAPADAMAVSFQWPFFRMLLAKFGSGLGPSLWFYGIGFCAGLLFALVRNRPLFFLGVAFTVGALAPFFIILRFSKLQVFSARYIIFSLPIFLLVTAYGWVEPLRLISDALGRWTKRQWVRFACMALGCSLVVAAVFTVSMPSIRGMFVVTNENWRDLCAFVARHKSDGDVVVLQRAYAQYMLGYYGKHLPPVHALEDGEIEKLDAICAQAKSVWYIGIWGCPSPGTAEKMKKLGFITLFDHTAQGIRLDLRLQSATPAKRLDAQIEWRKKASDEMWPHPWMDVWLARAYREKGNAARATQLLEKARTAYLRLCETDTWLLTNGSFRVIEMKDYGDLLKEMGRLDEARVVYYNILDLWPEKSFVYFALYNLERDAGNRMQAAECLLHYAALEPNHPVWIGDSLARMYLEADNVELAVNAYRDTYALALKRGDAGARYWWMLAGDTLAERNQPEEAIRELFALLQAHPDYALARAHLGRLLIKAKRNEEAAKVVHEGLQLTPDDELLKNLDKTLKGK